MASVSSGTSSFEFNIRSLLWSLVVNAGVPLLLYTVSKKYFGASEITALSISATFPILDSLLSIIRSRRLDIIAALALFGICINIIVLFLGGNPKILLIRESFLTGALGVLCFISLLFPRPLMFYVGRQLVAGSDKVKIMAVNKRWQIPHVRFANRIITIVWGVALLGEFVIRVLLVYSLPAVSVLAISPLVLTGITLITVAWTLRYVRSVREREQTGIVK